MSPTLHAHSHHREPAGNGYDSGFAGDLEDDYTGGKGRDSTGYVYSDSELKSRTTSRSRVSSGRRSRKNSSSSRELVRILIEEKADAERLQTQLERAYGVLRAESQRAVDAERAAIETAEKLKGTHRAHLASQQEAARLQAELRLYKLQFENAQSQLRRANDMISQSDLDLQRAESAMEKMRMTTHKIKGAELARRAREEGWRQGREEVLRELMVNEPAPPVPRGLRGEDRPPLVEEDDDVEEEEEEPLHQAASREVPQPQQYQATHVRAPESDGTAPLPVPPPASVPIMPRGPVRRSNPRQSAMAPPFHQDTQEDIYYQQMPPNAAHDMIMPDSRPIPDHIIVRSPLPVSASVPDVVNITAPRPSSSHAMRPMSRAAMLAQRDRGPYSQSAHFNPHPRHPQQPLHSHIHARSHSVDVPPALPDQVYPQSYSSSTSSDDHEFPMRSDSRTPRQKRGHTQGTGVQFDSLPQQEVIVPLPAPGQNYIPPRSSTVRPPSSARFARPRVTSVSSSSTTSSPGIQSDAGSFPRPSRVAQLRDRGRGYSSESSVPGIIIEPPSRPESTDTIATVATLPAHLSPFNPQPVMFSPEQPTAPVYSVHPPNSRHSAHDRPASRTGFRYGPSASPHSENIGLASPSGSIGSGTRHVSALVPGGGYPLQHFAPGAVTPGVPMGDYAPPGSFHDGSYPTDPRYGTTGGGPPSRSMSKTPTANRRGADSISGLPARPGSAADYFNADHHRSQQPRSHHRRAHSDAVSNTDTNAFHDPDTDPDLNGSQDSPQATSRRGAYPYDDGRSAGGRSGAGHSVTSRGAGFGDFGGLASPTSQAQSTTSAARRAPLPSSRTGSTVYREGAAASERSRPASRMSFGHTPFVRTTNGLYDD
ncbi:hypothetical protein M0805_002517 [Coniferiporia weirii]|nr:hypothetical protein M0805_002517 [Coniferiporia weirii]